MFTSALPAISRILVPPPIRGSRYVVFRARFTFGFRVTLVPAALTTSAFATFAPVRLLVRTTEVAVIPCTRSENVTTALAVSRTPVAPLNGVTVAIVGARRSGVDVKVITVVDKAFPDRSRIPLAPAPETVSVYDVPGVRSALGLTVSVRVASL